MMPVETLPLASWQTALTYAIAGVDWDKVSAAAATSDGGTDFFKKIETAFPDVYGAIGILIGAVFFSMLMAVVLFPVFQAMVLRWWSTCPAAARSRMASRSPSRRMPSP